MTVLDVRPAASPTFDDVDGRVDTLSHAARDLAAAVREATAGTPESAAFSPLQRGRLLAEVDRVIAVLSSTRADLLIAERDAGTWRGAGDPSVETWRGRTSRVGKRAAVNQVRQAEVLTRMPHVRDAALDGSISMEHVDALAKVAATAPAPVREALQSVRAQDELLDIARRVDAATFAKSAGSWAAEQDPAAHERGHQAQRAARYLHLTDTDEGLRIKGMLDSMSGHRLRLALEAVDPRPARDDDRSGEQRRADALVVLAETVLTSPETTSGAAVRPHVSMHMTEETWAALRTHFRQGHDGGAGARANGLGSKGDGRASDADGTRSVNRGGSDAASGVPFRCDPVTLDDGTPVPMSEVARTLCDCELTRVVVAADGAVLDLGRTQRVYTGVQRRAVVARDRTCGWPGCRQNARWCEIHHIRWWDRDVGVTSVDNGVLLCSFHHHEVHRQDLTITRVSDPPGEARPTRVGDPPGEAGPTRVSNAPGEAGPVTTRLGRPGDPLGPRPRSTRGNVSDPAHPYVGYVFTTQDGRTVAPAPRPVYTSQGRGAA